MDSERPKQYERKSPCSRCGELTFHICYAGDRLVCVTCFKAIAARMKESRVKSA